MPLDLFEAFKQRRSVRKFLTKKIDNTVINTIIEAAAWAPSASNLQGWKFIVIDDEGLKAMLVKLGGAATIEDAPVGILVLYDNRSINLEYSDYIQSASASIQNMLLASYALGIGSCWICRLPFKRKIRGILKIPNYFDPIAYVALGYPAQKDGMVGRKHKLSDLVSYNSFAFKEYGCSHSIMLMVNRIKRKLYFILKEISFLWKQ